MKVDIHTPRPCSSCKGSKVASYDATRVCHYCDGRGEFPGLDVKVIVDAILVSRGARKGQIKRSMCSVLGRGEDIVPTKRAYYVWRMARFHGGADVTMPWSASQTTAGDPFVEELDAISDRVALAAFGTDRAAMHRWGNLLGFAEPAPPGLPASAYEGGPVHDGNDPLTNVMMRADTRTE